MAGKTVSQKIEDLTEKVVGHIPTANYRLDELKGEMAELQERVRDLESKTVDLEGRVKALEKGTDRFWQIAPMVISVVGVIVSLVIALSKK